MAKLRSALIFTLFFLGATTHSAAQFVPLGRPGQLSVAALMTRNVTLQEMERLKFSGQAKQAVVLADQLWQSDFAQSDPASASPNPALFQSSWLAAMLHTLAGSHERAIALYQAALKEVRNGLPIDPLTRAGLIAGLLQSYQGAGQIDAAIAFIVRSAQDGTDVDALSAQRQSQLCRLYFKAHDPARAEPPCRLAQEKEDARLAALPAAVFLRQAQVLAIRQSLFEIATTVQDGSTALFSQADSVGNTAFSKPGESFLLTLSPHALLAQAYVDQADPGGLLAFYEGRFRQYANVVEKALASQPGAGYQPLEDEYARLGAYLAAANMPAQADAALRQSLRLNADRLSYVATLYNPLLVAGTVATRRAKASLYTSFVLANAATDEAALKHFTGELLQIKGLQSEMLAIRHKAVFASGDQALIGLYGKAEQAAAAGNEPDWKTAILGLKAQLPYPPGAVNDDGERFLAQVSARLGQKTLVSITRYTPFDFAKQAFAPAHYLAIRLQAGHIDARDIGTVDDIDLMVQRYRGAVGADHSQSGTARVRQLASGLYIAILAPLFGERLAAGDYVADLDGMLNLLPLEALIDGSSRYLVETGTWHYVSSARALLRDPARPEAAPGNTAVLLVDPDFDSRTPSNGNSPATPGADSADVRSAAAGRVGSFAPLPETGAEGRLLSRDLARMGMKVTTLKGAGANATALARLKAPRFLHIATHGFFIDDDLAPLARKGGAFTSEALSGGLSAGIALAGANRKPPSANRDGLFFLSQFRMLDLRGTELAVLSACDTAVGSVRIGDGVNSLRQSLELAGVQAQVTSLWKVPSAATTRLMAAFYQHLAQGTSKAVSLRRAKLDMLKTDPDPQSWAGFTVSGAVD
jgi:CHAT domain-containing protein